MPLKPLGKNVLVELQKPSAISPGGIHIADKAQKQDTNQGVVIAVGIKCEEVKPGMRVHLHGSGKLVEGGKYFLCGEEVVAAYDDAA